MKIKILKFGGTSLADKARINHVANIIKSSIDDDSKIVVVVSARSGHTNEIIYQISEVQNTTHILIDKEYDAALSSAENLSASLLSIALNKMNIKSCSMQAWQIPIITDSSFGKASILDIDNKKILELLEQNIIPIITGFQGITKDFNITTLGRGGSDTSAAALAASLNATICEIYTDVEGVYSGDPRVIKNAKKLKAISYEEMLELADSGAKVITSRAVRICKIASIPIHIRSSFNDIEGTLIISGDKIMEKCKISGVTNNSDIAVIYLDSEYKQNIETASILSDNNIHIISIIYNLEKAEIIIPLNEYSKAANILKSLTNKYHINTNLSLLSIIGLGIKHDSEIMSKILKYLKELEIEVHTLVSSEFKISLLIEEKHANDFLSRIHQEFIEKA